MFDVRADALAAGRSIAAHGVEYEDGVGRGTSIQILDERWDDWDIYVSSQLSSIMDSPWHFRKDQNEIYGGCHSCLLVRYRDLYHCTLPFPLVQRFILLLIPDLEPPLSSKANQLLVVQVAPSPASIGLLFGLESVWRH